MSRYLIPAEQARTEMVVLNSRFIATAAPVFNVDEARVFIHKIKTEFGDANHNVPAYLIGQGASVTAHCSDDGEPSGTAGRPALAVLQGSGLGDIAVVVTRYFGGTKLGTGGLVRAYTEAVKAVLAILPRAEKVSTYRVKMVLPYADFEQVRLLVREYAGQILDQSFEADVTLSIRLLTERFEGFQTALREFSRGSLQAEIMDANPETIMPLGSFAG